MNAYSQLRKQRIWLFVSLHLLLGWTVLASWVTGSKPVVCKYQGEWHVPVLDDQPRKGSRLALDLIERAGSDYKLLSYDLVLWPLFSRDPHLLKPEAAWLHPLEKDLAGNVYCLGTYELGRDLLAACIFGLQRSAWLGLLAMGIAGVLGGIIGSFAAFQSQRHGRISWVSAAAVSLLLLLILVEALHFAEPGNFSWTGLSGLVAVVISLAWLSVKTWKCRPKIHFSLDRISLAYVEIMKSIPGLLLLLLLVQIVPNAGAIEIALMLALLYSPVAIKYSRSFAMRRIPEPHIDALLALGASPARIYFRHVLPRVWPELFPVLVFGFAQVVLLEASLSFLGLGLSLDTVSLGTIMHAARSNPSAWWVVVFPAILLFWLVYSLNALGDWLSRDFSQDHSGGGSAFP
ncbi:MAG: ABC transporter permease subunit [Saprospiraceae bacterium]|nr:ABC transporter permease subunit [Saprospiraceae bacterium]